MTQATLHVVFTPSGAGSLRAALRNAGRDDRVIALSDSLSFGPIDPVACASRAEWVESQLGRSNWEEVTALSERFWDEALSPDHRKVAWLSRRSAMEFSGFLEWLHRLGDQLCEVVDLTDFELSRPSTHGSPLPAFPVVSVAMLPPKDIAGNNLFDRATALPATARQAYQTLWRQLRTENAPLRVLTGNTLASAPISFFDSLLMSLVTNDWRKVARIVGEAFASEVMDGVSQTGDLFLAARVNALVEAGRLELQGRSALDMRYSEVRLPAAR